jgi:hypothetical protein
MSRKNALNAPETRLPVLDDYSYLSWSPEISAYLAAHNLWSLMTGSRQPKVDDGADEDSEADDAKGRLILLSAVSPSQHSLILFLKTAKEM